MRHSWGQEHWGFLVPNPTPQSYLRLTLPMGKWWTMDAVTERFPVRITGFLGY